MSRDEDQRNEMEAMEAIYGQDYSVVRTESPREYHLTLTPHQDGTTNYGQLTARSHTQYGHLIHTCTVSLKATAQRAFPLECVSSSVVPSDGAVSSHLS